ncbi:MAG TPA: DUF3106 domain-containing protein [Candidatus Acidoferrales bacterium]|nr:DUF3106 domain-containing protein [Candidatus Acidoferrales bacterium]
MTLRRIALALTLALMAGLAAQPARAQRRRVSPPPPPPPKIERARPNATPKANKAADQNPRPNLRGMEGLPPKWIEKLQNMSPEEQQRFLQNNRRFQKLPPRRQAQILNNLQKWNHRSPTEQNALRDRARILERMSPAQRQYLRNVLLPQWQQLTAERRQLINGRLHTLQGMSASDRADALKDPKFMQGLTPDEQSILRGLDSLRDAPQTP